MYLPIKQTNKEKAAYKRMLERVEAIKNEMGSRYLLAKENIVKHKDANNE